MNKIMLVLEGKTISEATEYVLAHPKEASMIMGAADMLHAIFCSQTHTGPNKCGYYNGTMEEKTLIVETYVNKVLTYMDKYGIDIEQVIIILRDIAKLHQSYIVYEKLGRTTMLPFYLDSVESLLATLDRDP